MLSLFFFFGDRSTTEKKVGATVKLSGGCTGKPQLTSLLRATDLVVGGSTGEGPSLQGDEIKKGEAEQTVLPLKPKSIKQPEWGDVTAVIGTMI